MDTCESCYNEADTLDDNLICDDCRMDIAEAAHDYLDKYSDNF